MCVWFLTPAGKLCRSFTCPEYMSVFLWLTHWAAAGAGRDIWVCRSGIWCGLESFAPGWWSPKRTDGHPEQSSSQETSASESGKKNVKIYRKDYLTSQLYTSRVIQQLENQKPFCYNIGVLEVFCFFYMHVIILLVRYPEFNILFFRIQMHRKLMCKM